MHWPFVIFSGNTHTTLDCDPGAQRGKHEAVGIRLSALRGEDHEFIAAVPSPTAGQLFADAWSACYITALGLAPSLKKVTLPPDFVGQTDLDGSSAPSSRSASGAWRRTSSQRSCTWTPRSVSKQTLSQKY
jgi:osmotically inducible protein OsmC